MFRDRGTLSVGAPADVTILELRLAAFEFVDNYGNVRTGEQRLYPSETVVGGRIAPRAYEWILANKQFSGDAIAVR